MKRKARNICCDAFMYHCHLNCTTHNNKYDCPDALMDQHDNGEFGIIIHDGGASMIAISFCPWCGQKLTNLNGAVV